MMRRQFRKWAALALCAALVLGLAGPAGAQGGSAPSPAKAEQCVYAQADETTFVPAGYTYVYEGENGQSYTRVANNDMYITGRVLTAAEAESLAELSGGEAGYMTAEDGSAVTCREFDAKEAAACSAAVQEILGEASLEEGQTVSVLSQTYGPSSLVKVMILLDADSVSQMQTMQVHLGEAVGAAERDAMQALRRRQQSTVQAINRELGYDIQVSGSFTLLTNAVSATVKYADLAAINQMDGVKKAFLMPSYRVPEIQAGQREGGISPNLKYAAPAMGAEGAWDLGYRGEGMSIAVLDTGLCYENPSFSIEPSDPARAAFSRDDVADLLDAGVLHAQASTDGLTADQVYYSSKIPYGYNYGDGRADYGSDDETMFGHGTHVAGIAAGNLVEEAKEEFDMDSMGMAPEAQLVVMKVFDSDGVCYLDYLVAALEDAILLGVDCANLSLGSACGPVYYEGVTEVYDAADRAGIQVVVSAGNDASTGYRSYWGGGMVESSSVSTGTVGMPGSFDSVLTVASVENDAEINLGGDTVSWYNAEAGLRQFLSYAEWEDIPEGKGFRENLVSRELAFTDTWDDAAGKLVFAPFEGGNADSIAAAAAEAGAAGVLLYDPTVTAEEAYGYVDYTLTRFDVPMAATNLVQYDWMLQQGPEGGLLRVDDFWNPSATAGQMSGFSSWGPTDGLTLKPEIAGIGGNVFSAYYGDYYALASGTSMAAPAVAAAAALVRQSLEETDLTESEITRAVNCLLMSTATPVVDEAHGTYYPVRQQGAGLVHAAAAVASQAYLQVEGTNKAKLELGDDPDRTGSYEMTFQVVNRSDAQKVYTLDTTVLGQVAQSGQIKNGETTYLVPGYARELDADVRSSVPGGTVTVPANSCVEITVTVNLSADDRAYMDERFPYGSYVEGFVQLLSDETPNLSLPFLAFYGDFGQGPVLEEGAYDTLLGGDKAYTTADQFHNAIWSSLPAYSQEELAGFGGRLFYLGDSRGVENEKVPAASMSEQPPFGYLPFYSSNAGISPNGDGILDSFSLGLGLKRNAAAIHYTVTDLDTGEVLWEQTTEPVSKTYFSDTDNAVLYGGVFTQDALSMDWLYPIVEEDWDGDGVTDYAYYDTSRCLLEENTWVSIQAQAIGEYQSETPNANDTVAFSLYIDTTAPLSPERFVFSDRNPMAELFGEEEKDGMYHVKMEHDEFWFLDYDMSISLDYNETAGRWEGLIFTTTYASQQPARGESGISSSGFYPFDAGSKYLYLGYDYAGNVSAYELKGGENLLDLVELESAYAVAAPGETVTLENTAEHAFGVEVSWSLSEDTAAEMVASDGDSCRIRARQPGELTVSAGFLDYCRSVRLIVTDPAVTGRYSDITGHWAEKEMQAVLSLGLFRGTGSATFRPERPLTRAELVTVLYRMEGEPSLLAQNPFRDVPGNRWYSNAVIWAAAQGIVTGKTPDRFDPDAPVTREQIAAVLYRYAAYLGADTSARGKLEDYSDAHRISRYAVDAMSWAVAAGLLQGVDSAALAPKHNATRAQAAVLLIRFRTL